MSETETLLYVDAEQTRRDKTASVLRAESQFNVIGVNSLEEAKHHLKDRDIDIVVTEYQLPDGDGLDVATYARDINPEHPVFFYTNSSTDDIDTTEHEGLIVDHHNRTDMSKLALVDAIEKAIEYRTQVAYPVPEDETQRLAALAEYDVDNYEFREYLDTLTSLIAQTFEAEYATVGLVEEHDQRFLSCHGADVDSVARGDTICTYTIMAGGVMTVEDTNTDPRFENNEVLEGLDIRSYAGAPLIASSGAVIGTVCIFDTKPRTFTETEREQLRRFADITIDQLEMRRKATLADQEAVEN